MLAAVGGALAISIEGSPWVGAKALATGSPAILLAGMAGAAALAARGRRVEATVLALAIAAGVVWSNALAYHEVNLAPRDRHAELEEIGEAIAGEGPTLMTEYEPYGVRHFLRKGDPEGASELRRRPVLLRSGRQLEKLEVGGRGRARRREPARLPHAGAAPLAGGEPAAVDLHESAKRPLLRRLAARSGVRAQRAPAHAARLRPRTRPRRRRATSVRQLAGLARAQGGRLAVAQAACARCGSGWRRRPDRTGDPTRPSKER